VGLLNPLYNGVSWVLLQWHTFWSLIFPADSGAAWALSIVMLVVLIRICLIPLFVRQIKAQRGLQALQPQMKAIQQKYKNDRAKQSEEMMKLYKDTGTNPLSSCLPIVVQAPFFFALFHVLSYLARGQTVGLITDPETVASAHSATIFGAPIYETFVNGDLNTKIVAAIFIVAMTATTFTTQRQLMVKNQPMGVQSPLMQQQKILLYVFPAMFAVFGINFPIGVLIYWLTTNLWSMAQQFYVIRRNPTPGSAAAIAREERQQAREAEKRAQDVAAGLVVEEPTPAPAPRAQPKKTSRSQRKAPGGPPPKTPPPSTPPPKSSTGNNPPGKNAQGKNAQGKNPPGKSRPPAEEKGGTGRGT
jgi:YidC/Oxa1 family membrane protein insertase